MNCKNALKPTYLSCNLKSLCIFYPCIDDDGIISRPMTSTFWQYNI